jgi:hypothetical protein
MTHIILEFHRSHASSSPLWEHRHLCVTRSQDFLLSFVNHVRYTYARTACPIPTPSSICLIRIGRVGDDL